MGLPSSAHGASNSERLVLSVQSAPEQLLLCLCALFSPWLCSSRAGWGQLPSLPGFATDFAGTCRKSLNRLLPARFFVEGGNLLNSHDKLVLESLFRGPRVK